MGQGLYDFGEEPAAANVVKLTGNFLVAAALEAIAEALTLAEKQGMDRSQVIEMFAQTSFGGPIYSMYGKAIMQQRYTPAGFSLSLGLKDVGLVLQTAHEVQMPMPFASLLHDRLLASLAKGGEIWIGQRWRSEFQKMQDYRRAVEKERLSNWASKPSWSTSIVMAQPMHG
jgi:3-hydroxyisobutyrate dehydrogenase-like beta-hydroxyacid dehydrogenase